MAIKQVVAAFGVALHPIGTCETHIPACLEVLKTMHSLRELILNSTDLSEADFAALRKALPKCAVKSS